MSQSYLNLDGSSTLKGADIEVDFYVAVLP